MENKKRILLVCYRGQEKDLKKVLKKLSAEVTLKVTSKKNLSALNDPWDVVLCTSEPYEVLNISCNDDQTKNYEFLVRARKLYPEKNIYRIGYGCRIDDTSPFIRMSNDLPELRERILNVLN